MKKIIVNIKKRSYPIYIAFDLFNDTFSFAPLKPGDQAMLITNKTLAPFFIKKIYYLFKQINIKTDIIIIPDGEKYKNITVLNTIFTALIKKSHNRDTTLVALGGGVVGDITGFAAASYQRGVRFIQIPTTLLSQVDSSIGGKTAINHYLGKNMIGAFWQPSAVMIDLNYLKTLPSRELFSGLAEVIKYGIILDMEFFNWLENNIDNLLCLDESAIFYCISRCCELKAKIVSIDEYETGSRTLLNFGHTYGHAIEVGMGYGKWLHGEAIALGMIIAARVSEYLGQLKKEETQRIIDLLQYVGLPVTVPNKISAQAFLSYMIRDKKTLAGKIRLILPLTIGKGEIFNDISHEIILASIINSQNKIN